MLILADVYVFLSAPPKFWKIGLPSSSSRSSACMYSIPSLTYKFLSESSPAAFPFSGLTYSCTSAFTQPGSCSSMFQSARFSLSPSKSSSHTSLYALLLELFSPALLLELFSPALLLDESLLDELLLALVFVAVAGFVVSSKVILSITIICFLSICFPPTAPM